MVILTNRENSSWKIGRICGLCREYNNDNYDADKNKPTAIASEKNFSHLLRFGNFASDDDNGYMASGSLLQFNFKIKNASTI